MAKVLECPTCGIDIEFCDYCGTDLIDCLEDEIVCAGGANHFCSSDCEELFIESNENENSDIADKEERESEEEDDDDDYGDI